jgi:hypothetical protein
MNYCTILLLILIFVINTFAQKEQKKYERKKESTTNRTINKTSTPMELAQIALQAHGGDKFKNMKTLVIRGTADVSGSPTQTIPATFVFVSSGEKYRIDIPNPFQPLKQVYDGEQTTSSINGFYFPPLNRIGLALLTKIGEKDFIVSALQDKSKVKNAFRITSPEGYYTDFYLNEKSGQIKSYRSSFDVNGRTVTTAVEIDKVRNVENVIVPEQYSQRFELTNLSIYVSFKAKEILVNSPIADNVFSMAN